jgi:hypothetical protein
MKGTLMQTAISIYKPAFSRSPKSQVFWILILFIGFGRVSASPIKEAKLWEPVTWNFRNPSYSGNPFDLVVKASFTHTSSGRKIQTEFFYDSGNTWKLRFTGTHTGRWRFVSESSDPEFNGLKGDIEVRANPGVPGFMTNYGSKWGRLGIDQAFVPQYVMYCDPPVFYRNPDRIDADIRKFFVGHGFNGFHTAVLCRWFDLNKTRYSEIASSDPNPDPRTFEALELLIQKVHAANGVVFIWAWGDEQRRMTPKKWGINGKVDRRLQRYICARLGPLPGWSMGYGFDLQEWVNEKDLRTWHEYMHSHLGWFHFLGGRAPDLTQICDGLDYSSYQQHRPDYNIYVKSIMQYPNKPTFLEDRFRVRKNVYPDRPDGVSHPYPNKEQIKTWSLFWQDRFKKEMIRDNSITDGVCMKVQSKLLVFYKDNVDSIKMNLSELRDIFDAVAVDTRKKYKELRLSNLAAKPNQVFKAPYKSDWAIAVQQ